MIEKIDIIVKNNESKTSTFNELSENISKAVTLNQIVMAVLKLTLFFAILIVEETLNSRAQVPEKGLVCPQCGKKLENKGFESRQIKTIFGIIKWRRRIHRCPNKCGIGQIVPFDETLGIRPNQKTSDDFKRLCCLLAVFMPYNISAMLIKTLTGIEVSPNTIWEWVQIMGSNAMLKLEQELKKLSEGEFPEMADLDRKVMELILAIGADGVMVPFRPNEKSPDGKAKWYEIKIGIFARLKEKITKKGKKVNELIRKRVVAVLGNVDDLKGRMELMAIKEGINNTEKVVWISDGGRGFWRLFHELFSSKAQGILDFFHAAQNLWKGAKEWLDGRTQKAKNWFFKSRRELKKGNTDSLLKELREVVLSPSISDDTKAIINNLVLYLETHMDHINYGKYKALGYPIGSGMVESTCKWLIQQRFKGTGMRWSVNGFNHLLHLRLAWVNEEFDELSFAPPN